MADLHWVELIDDGPMGVDGFRLALDGFELKGVESYVLDAIDPEHKTLTITLLVQSINARRAEGNRTDTTTVTTTHPPGTPMVTNWDRSDIN